MESERMVVDLFVWLVCVNDQELIRRRPCHALEREGEGFFVSEKGSEGFSKQKNFGAFLSLQTNILKFLFLRQT